MSNCPASALTTKVTGSLYPHRALRLWPALAIRKNSEVASVSSNHYSVILLLFLRVTLIKCCSSATWEPFNHSPGRLLSLQWAFSSRGNTTFLPVPWVHLPSPSWLLSCKLVFPFLSKSGSRHNSCSQTNTTLSRSDPSLFLDTIDLLIQPKLR